jgi:hypothetical protein
MVFYQGRTEEAGSGTPGVLEDDAVVEVLVVVVFVVDVFVEVDDVFVEDAFVVVVEAARAPATATRATKRVDLNEGMVRSEERGLDC